MSRRDESLGYADRADGGKIVYTGHSGCDWFDAEGRLDRDPTEGPARVQVTPHDDPFSSTLFVLIEYVSHGVTGRTDGPARIWKEADVTIREEWLVDDVVHRDPADGAAVSVFDRYGKALSAEFWVQGEQIVLESAATCVLPSLIERIEHHVAVAAADKNWLLHSTLTGWSFALTEHEGSTFDPDFAAELLELCDCFDWGDLADAVLAQTDVPLAQTA